jgi:hypothetical protein
MIGNASANDHGASLARTSRTALTSTRVTKPLDRIKVVQFGEATMRNILLSRLMVAAGACAIAACGGGGGGVEFTPPPPGPTTKTCPDGSVIPIAETCPQPPPATSPAIFSDVTTDTNFAVLGLEASAIGQAASDLTKTGFSVRYDAETTNYLIDLPSGEESPFIDYGEDASYWNGYAAGGSYLNVFKPTSTNPEMQLDYTSFGAITQSYYSSDFGFFTFGIPTPATGVPVTGSAGYNAMIVGSPLDIYGKIDGDATLQFNFGAGTLSGHLDPVLHYNGVDTDLGTYNFVNTVFGVGSASFSGGLSHAGTSSVGAFDGRFTGPAAQELMGRWSAPYLNPSTQQWNAMFGIMVGKKQ